MIKVFKRGWRGCYEFFDDCPQCVIDLFLNIPSKQRIISFDFYKKHRQYFPPTKTVKVLDICECCKTCSTIFVQSLEKRTLEELKHRFICQVCIMKCVGSSQVWKKSNSETQKIVQNKPEVKLKNTNSLKETWAIPERRKKWHAGITKSNQNLEKRQKNSVIFKEKFKNDSAYRDKVLKNWTNFRGIAGVFYSKNNGQIRFDSSYEFFYLLECDFKGKKTERCKFRLPYLLNNENRYYKPDFLEDNKTIKEIKSSYTRDSFQTKEELKQKKKAVLRFCKENKLSFRLITEKEISFLKYPSQVPYLLDVFQKNNIIVFDKPRTYKITLSSNYYDKSQKVFEKWNLLK